MWHPGSPGSLSSVHRLCVTSQRTSLFSLQCQRLFRWLAQLKFAKLRENLRKKMITVSTKRLYSLGKIKASPKGLAITSNLSSGKEVGVTGGGGWEEDFCWGNGTFTWWPPPPLRVSCLFLSPYTDGGIFMISSLPPPLSQSPQKASVTIYFLTHLPEGCRYINLLQFLLSNSISLKNSKYADG